MKIRNFMVAAVASVFVVATMGNAAFAKDPDPMQQQQQQQMQQQVPVKMAPPPPGMPMPGMGQQMPDKPGMGMPSAQHKPDQMQQQPRHHQKARYIRVHRGDTLSRIAIRYHVRVIQLKRLNHLRGDKIFVGQRLRVR